MQEIEALKKTHNLGTNRPQDTRQFIHLLEIPTYLILSYDREGRITWANQATRLAFKYGREEILNVNLTKLIDPDWRETFIDSLNSDEETQPFEVLVHTKEKDELFIEMSPLKLMKNGEHVGFQCIARDISARKQALRKLEESERRFRETAELLPGVICETDLQMKLTYVNQKALESFGYTREEFEKGVNVFDIIAPDHKERAVQGVRFVMTGTRGVKTTYMTQRKDGARQEMLISSAPLEVDGKVSGIRSCLLDISDLKEAERKLRESEERFRRIYSQSPVGIALTDNEGGIKSINKSFGKLFNLNNIQEAQDLNANLFEIAGLDEDQRIKLSKGQRIEHHQWYQPTPETSDTSDIDTHEPRFYEWYIAPLRSEAESEKEILFQVQDTTEQRKAEKTKLQEAQQETEKAKTLIRSLREQITEKSTFHNMVSRSNEMKRIFDILPQIAEASASVLVYGESGTGKELIAKSIHDLGPRKEMPFVAINCSALPDTLLESELFGYKAGAFTDAKRDKPGKFALAEGGTIFLDEIGDISPAMQVKLLRVLQEKCYEPLGGTKTCKADVRVIAATNRDLKIMVKEGSFRQDLYYRINVLNITLPSLRERRTDIPVLCDFFIKKFNAQYGREVKEISPTALEALLSHEFPGNVRELENILEHAFVFCRGSSIELSHLPGEITGEDYDEAQIKALAKIGSFDDLERLYIQAILAETGGNKNEAARRLGIHKTTFFRKLKKLGVDTKKSDIDEPII